MPNEVLSNRLKSPAIPTQGEAEKAWVEVERLTLEACILRKEGHEEKAAHLLSEKLPPLLKHWAILSDLPAEERKEKLRNLISNTQKSVEEAFLQRRLIVDEVMRRLSGDQGRDTISRVMGGRRAVVAQPLPAFQLRRRIPIHDVCGMIDALQESEVARTLDNVLPVRPLLQPVAAF